MENTEFEVRFLKEENRQLNHDGFDQIEFYITTNPGEPLKPLVKVASGGELSRMLLALKTIFSSEQGVTSIIFDEVDTGEELHRPSQIKFLKYRNTLKFCASLICLKLLQSPTINIIL